MLWHFVSDAIEKEKKKKKIAEDLSVRPLSYLYILGYRHSEDIDTEFFGITRFLLIRAQNLSNGWDIGNRSSSAIEKQLIRLTLI